MIIFNQCNREWKAPRLSKQTCPYRSALDQHIRHKRIKGLHRELSLFQWARFGHPTTCCNSHLSMIEYLLYSLKQWPMKKRAIGIELPTRDWFALSKIKIEVGYWRKRLTRQTNLPAIVIAYSPIMSQ